MSLSSKSGRALFLKHTLYQSGLLFNRNSLGKTQHSWFPFPLDVIGENQEEHYSRNTYPYYFWYTGIPFRKKTQWSDLASKIPRWSTLPERTVYSSVLTVYWVCTYTPALHPQTLLSPSIVLLLCTISSITLVYFDAAQMTAHLWYLC